jgi:hypothetical protein
MGGSISWRVLGLAAAVGLLIGGRAFGWGYASAVVSYNPGTNRFQFGAYTNPDVALGLPQTNPGDGIATTPFNNPYNSNDVVSVGLGGELTLQLSTPANGSDPRPQIGVFTFQQFVQQASGGTDGGPTLFYPSIQADVDVSSDGNNWVSLNGGNPIAFNIPANAFADVAAAEASDYGEPFIGSLAFFANEPSEAATLAAFGGTGGGTWLNISGTGLDEVDFIRLSVPATDAYSFQLDAVTVSDEATIEEIPEPGMGGMLAMLSLGLLLRRRKQC